MPQEVRDLPCAVWGANPAAPPRWTLGGTAVDLAPTLATNDYEHLCRRAVAGDVSTELPSFLAANHIRAGRLLHLLPDHPLPEEDIHLVYPRHRHPSAIVQTYLDFCLARVSELEAGASLTG